MADLVIKISAKADEFNSELEKIRSKADGLQGHLESVGKKAALAFAAVSAGVGVALNAYGESEKAANKLTQAIENQGLQSGELVAAYKAQASEAQRLTGIDDDSIVSAQASIQAHLGQMVVTQDLTNAIVDMAAAKEMDVKATAELIGKGISGHTKSLKMLGIEVEDGLSKQERMARIIELVTVKFGGQAEAMNKGVGSIQGLKSAFGDFMESIGERFAPAFTAMTKKATEFFAAISKNDTVVDLVVALTAFVGVTSGVVAAVAAIGVAFLKLSAIFTALSAVFGGVISVVGVLTGAAVLGALAGIGYVVWKNWSEWFPKASVYLDGIVNKIKSLAGMKAEEIKGPIMGPASPEGEAENEKYKKKAALAEKEHQAFLADEARKKAVKDSSLELELLQMQGHSDSLIQIKQQEAELLKQIEDEKNATIREQLQAHLEEKRIIEDEAKAIDLEQQNAFLQSLQDMEDQYGELGAAQKQMFLDQNKTKLMSARMTEGQARQLFLAQEMKANIDHHNQRLLDQQRFGKAYADFNYWLQNSQIGKSAQFFTTMQNMQQSHNAILKTVGKTAALTQIAINTAQGATMAYAQLGPIAGSVAAAMIVAFGVEQAAHVISAAEGGIMTGGVRGRDSIPTLTMPGELVVPTKNFDEVVNSVARDRAGNDSTPESTLKVVIEMNDDAQRIFTARQIEDRQLGLYRGSV